MLLEPAYDCISDELGLFYSRPSDVGIFSQHVYLLSKACFTPDP